MNNSSNLEEKLGGGYPGGKNSAYYRALLYGSSRSCHPCFWVDPAGGIISTTRVGGFTSRVPKVWVGDRHLLEIDTTGEPD